MKKITKKPKRAVVLFTASQVTSIRSEYICPTCKINFYNDGPRPNVTRFRCECGQELIVVPKHVKHVTEEVRYD